MGVLSRDLIHHHVVPVFGRTAQIRVALLSAQASQLPAREPVFLVSQKNPQAGRDNYDGHDHSYHDPRRHSAIMRLLSCSCACPPHDKSLPKCRISG